MLFFKSNKTKLGKFDKQPLVTKLVNYGSVSVESVLTMRRRRPLARFSFQFARDIGESICQRFKMVSLVTTTSFLSLSVSLSRLVSSHLSSHLSRSQNGATCFVRSRFRFPCRYYKCPSNRHRIQVLFLFPKLISQENAPVTCC
jgi:hypothetical protein